MGTVRGMKMFSMYGSRGSDSEGGANDTASENEMDTPKSSSNLNLVDKEAASRVSDEVQYHEGIVNAFAIDQKFARLSAEIQSGASQETVDKHSRAIEKNVGTEVHSAIPNVVELASPEFSTANKTDQQLAQEKLPGISNH